MWVFNFIMYLLFWAHLVQYGGRIPTADCYYYDQELGDRLGVHEDPAKPPMTCFEIYAGGAR